MIIEYLISVATFNIVPTSMIDEMIYYFPEADAFSPNFEMVSIESTFLLANLQFTTWVILFYVLLILASMILYMFKDKAQCVRKLYEKLSKKLYWDGLIRLHMELFMDMLLLPALNLHTVVWDTKFDSVQASNILSIISILFTCSASIVLAFIYLRHPKEQRIDLFSTKFGTIFDGINLERQGQRWAIVLAALLFFFKRVAFILIILVLKDYILL